MTTPEHIASQFNAWLKTKGWTHLGRDSLAKKLKVSSSVIQSAREGKELQRRSKYLLWKSTGLDCFEVQTTPLEEWMYKNNHYPSSLAKLIEKKTGKKINVNTLESISQSSNPPTRENADLIHQVTGLDFFAPNEDPAAATRRILDGGEATGNQEKPAVDPGLNRELAILKHKVAEISKTLGIDWEEMLSPTDRFAQVFELLIESLVYFKTATPFERKALVESVGPERLAHWVGMLSALDDEKQFSFWLQMSREPS